MPGDAASIRIAEINAQNGIDTANISANASKYGAKTGADAQMYGADQRLAGDTNQTSAYRDVSAAREAGDMARAKMNNATTLSGQLMAGDPQSSYDITKNLLGKLSGPGYSKGTAQVPGHGDGTVDTVDAKLAPGEAVLNKAAAEMLGRGLIDLLNKNGMLKMGMPDPQEEAAEGEPGYACGTSMVKKYAAGTSNVQDGSSGRGDNGSYLNRSGSSGRADTEAPMSFFPTGERGDGGTGRAETDQFVPFGRIREGMNGSAGSGRAPQVDVPVTPAARPQRYKF